MADASSLVNMINCDPSMKWAQTNEFALPSLQKALAKSYPCQSYFFGELSKAKNFAGFKKYWDDDHDLMGQLKDLSATLEKPAERLETAVHDMELLQRKKSMVD